MSDQKDTIIKQVLKNAREKGLHPTKALASFVVETLFNEDTKKFFLEDPIPEDQNQVIIDKANEFIEDPSGILYKIMNLQIKFEASSMQQEAKLTDDLNYSSAESMKLIDSILEVKSTGANNYDTLTQLYQRILFFLIYKNNQLSFSPSQPSPHAESTSREVNTALESIIPRNALSPFIMLTNPEKATQLSELNNLVLGVRLFNKEISNGSQGLEDVEALVHRFDEGFVEEIKKSLNEVAGLVEDYEQYISMAVDNMGNHDQQEIETLKKELIFLRQYLQFALVLYEKTENSYNIMEVSRSRYIKESEDLKHLLANNTSAPKEKVYPKFSMIATTYMALFEESRNVDAKKVLFEILTESINSVTLSFTSAQGATAQRLALQEKEEDRPLRYEHKNAVYFIEPKNTPEFLQTPLDFAGFSLVSLVDHEGFLANGRHELGVFKYEDFMLVFRNHQEIKKFMDAPSDYLDKFYEICRKTPALIVLLKLEDYFKEKNVTVFEMKEDFKEAAKLMKDMSTNTLKHIHEIYDTKKNIVRDYQWNEWELRRRAIQMVNIRNMTTKATQTPDSLYMVANATQVWLKKEATTMTGIESGTNPIRPRNYITELRQRNN